MYMVEVKKLEQLRLTMSPAAAVGALVASLSGFSDREDENRGGRDGLSRRTGEGGMGEVEEKGSSRGRRPVVFTSPDRQRLL